MVRNLIQFIDLLLKRLQFHRNRLRNTTYIHIWMLCKNLISVFLIFFHVWIYDRTLLIFNDLQMYLSKSVSLIRHRNTLVFEYIDCITNFSLYYSHQSIKSILKHSIFSDFTHNGLIGQCIWVYFLLHVIWKEI